MNTAYYDQLHELLHTNPKLDIFNLYFLGICTEYASEATSLDWLLNQLPLNFPRLFEVFMGNKHEIGFISRTLLRIIHNIPQEDRSPSTQDIFDCERSEIEEDLKRILKDFELVRLLYPRVTKFQWFYLGIFMAKNRSFELLALLKGVYIDLLVRNYKYDEQGKVDFLASLLTEKYKPETLPPSSRAIRTGKIQAISSKLADLKRDLRSLVNMRSEMVQREQKEEQEIRYLKEQEMRCLRSELVRREKEEDLEIKIQAEKARRDKEQLEIRYQAEREQKERAAEQAERERKEREEQEIRYQAERDQKEKEEVKIRIQAEREEQEIRCQTERARKEKEELEIRCLERERKEREERYQLEKNRKEKEEQEIRCKAEREQREKEQIEIKIQAEKLRREKEELERYQAERERRAKEQAIRCQLERERKEKEELEKIRFQAEREEKERKEQEIRWEGSCSIVTQARKEVPPLEVIGRRLQESRRRLVLRPRENVENKDPMKEEQPRPKFSSVYPKENFAFMRRPLQNMDTNIVVGRMQKVEPLVKCSPLMMEKISPKLKIDPKEKITNETNEIESRITKNIEAKSIPRDVRLTIIPPRVFQDCPICFEIATLSTSVSLKLCNHFFHKKCLQEYFITRINEKSFPIVCAMDGCGSLILESQIIEALDQTYKDKFYSFSLKHFIETHKNEVFCCPTPNCEYFAFQDKVKKSFYCKKCAKAFCVECQGEWHDGMTCEEVKAEDENLKKFNEYVTVKGCQKCPSCQYFIEKNEGCDHMTCRCGKEFCYSCLSDMDQCYCRRDEY